MKFYKSGKCYLNMVNADFLIVEKNEEKFGIKVYYTNTNVMLNGIYDSEEDALKVIEEIINEVTINEE